MIILVALVVLVLLVGVAIVGGATGLAGGERRRGDGVGHGAAVAVPAAVAAGVVVLVVVVVFGLGGARTARGPETDTESERTVPDEREEPVPLEGSPATFDRRVSVSEGTSPLRPLPIVDGLAAGDVIEVWGLGFLEHAEGVVAQCSSADATVCRNVAPVLTDGEGRLRVAYRIEEPWRGEVLVVEVDFARGAARLAFGSTPALRPVLSVTDDDSVAVRGAAPGERVTIRRCADAADAVEECSVVSTVTVAGDGTAQAALDAASDQAERLTLVDAAGHVLAEPILVEAARQARSEVDLDPTQLLGGSAAALLLLGIAVAIIRTTDWRVPAEAATPFLDDATFDA